MSQINISTNRKVCLKIRKCSLPKNASEHILHVRTLIVVFPAFEFFDKNNVSFVLEGFSLFFLENDSRVEGVLGVYPFSP